MKSRKNWHVLNCALLIASVAAVFLIPFEAFARQAAATPSTQASSATQPTDELRVSAYTKHEELKLKLADLKAMPRTTVSVHNIPRLTRLTLEFGLRICWGK